MDEVSDVFTSMSLMDTMLISLREAEAAIREEENQPDGIRPASKKDLDTLETECLQEDDERLGEMCGVCLEIFIVDDKCSRLQCNHSYHTDCCVEWFKIHGTCPLCRFVVGTPPRTPPIRAKSERSNSGSHIMPQLDL